MEHWSIDDYKNFTNSKVRKTKYRANKTSIDGHTFDSQKEADYYCQLKLRLQAKEINGFCLQPTFMLAPGLKYKADFIVFNSVLSLENSKKAIMQNIIIRIDIIAIFSFFLIKNPPFILYTYILSFLKK